MKILEYKKICSFAKTGFYFQRTNGRRLNYELHGHDFYEFLYIVSGKCVHEIDGVRSELFAGSLIVLTPSSVHRFIFQTENTDIIAISVASDEIKKLFSLYESNDFFVKSNVYELGIGKRKILVAMCEGIIFAKTEEYILRMRLLINQLLIFCTDFQYEKPNAPESFNTTLEKMQELSYAAEGMSAFLRLSGYSHSQLCRLTKKYMGITPTEYINRIRMNHAYEFIVTSNSDYESICGMVGFESFSYFSKLIKRFFGCSASQLRKGSKAIEKTL